ncbi:hypothetical protein J6590_093103 [Homalodisca vitripennis]|nr:hypothetical protein J6590_093103 [Homalodisca vitripennis]
MRRQSPGEVVSSSSARKRPNQVAEASRASKGQIRDSITKLKITGDIGQPWRTPDWKDIAGMTPPECLMAPDSAMSPTHPKGPKRRPNPCQE